VSAHGSAAHHEAMMMGSGGGDDGASVGAAAAGRTNPRRVGRALSNPTGPGADRVLYRDSALAHDSSAPALPGSATEARTRRGIQSSATNTKAAAARGDSTQTHRPVSMGRGPGGSTGVMTGGVAREHMLAQAGVKSSAGRAGAHGRDPVNALPMPVATATKGSASATASFIARSSAAEAISAARRVYTDRMGQRTRRSAGRADPTEAAMERRSGALPGAPSGPASRQSRASDGKTNSLFWGRQDAPPQRPAAPGRSGGQGGGGGGGGGGSTGRGSTIVSAARRTAADTGTGRDAGGAGVASGGFESVSGMAAALGARGGVSGTGGTAAERAMAQRGAISFQGPSRSRRGADGSILAPVEAPGRISGHGVRRIGSNRSLGSNGSAAGDGLMAYAPHQPRAQASGPSVRWGGAGKGSSSVLPGPRYDSRGAAEPGAGRRAGPKTRYS
jgi:hypothetical protein